MPRFTKDLNPDESLCDAYPEAGHAVVGVALGLQLISVTGKTATSDPHCDWDHSHINTLLQQGNPANRHVIQQYTEDHAVMCLTPRFSEATVCDVTSDEQALAFHCDYLDAEWMRKCCGINYFGFNGIKPIEN